MKINWKKIVAAVMIITMAAITSELPIFKTSLLGQYMIGMLMGFLVGLLTPFVERV